MSVTLLGLRLLAEAAVLCAVLWLCTRPSTLRHARVLTFVSFGIRFAIGEGLYLVSVFRLPIARSMQTAPGFWILSEDAAGYDQLGRQAAQALLGRPATVQQDQPFQWVIGAVYAVFGANPSQALLLNAAIAAACVPLAYLIATNLRLSGAQRLAFSALVGFWPSSLAWSGQTLKDPLLWLSIFAVAAGASSLFGTDSLRWRVGGASLLLAGELVLSVFRGYPNLVWLGAIAFGAVVYLVQMRHDLRPAAATLALAALALLGGNIPAIQGALGAGAAPSGSGEYQVAQAVSVLARTPTAVETTPPAVGSTVATQAPRPLCRPAQILLVARNGFNLTGGGSMVDTGVDVTTCWDVIRYVPRALELVFAAPTPDMWLQPGATVGAVRYMSGLDGLLLWLLLPGLLAGWARTIIRLDAPRATVLMFVLVLAFAMGIVVTNFGTLFRIRLQVLLLGLVFAVYGWAWLIELAKRWRPSNLLAGESRLYPSTVRK